MKVAIVGAGGHARVVCEILRLNPSLQVVGFTDTHPSEQGERIFGLPILGSHDLLEQSRHAGIEGVIVAIGDNQIREMRFKRLRSVGYSMITAFHPTSVVSSSATVGDGTVVAPGAFVQTLARVGENCIVNTGAIVEHEVELGDHVHVAPRSIVAGRVRIGARTFVGAGSVVKEYVQIGSDVVVGAGSVILSDVPSAVLVAGSPATVRKQLQS